ncbi:MAG: class I SAM-dependent methyltransferase [Desulfuromonadales bacterium]|nr:class I SAM-dependent methyltransferase [Desulfuromonadales bacterium]
MADGSLCDVLLANSELLVDSREFSLGMRELRRRLPGGLRWYHAPAGQPVAIADFLAWSNAPFLLVILNPALGISDNLAEELTGVLSASDEAIACVLPGDPRSAGQDLPPDYANRSGFDRFVARLKAGPRQAAYDGREPWIYLVRRSALQMLVARLPAIDWADVPAMLGGAALIARRAFVHSYADYYAGDRSEMLHLVPECAETLLDVGGGEGRFARLFMAERGGQATLLEANPRAAARARAAGIEVLTGDFEALVLGRQFDCVTFLDVLEHLDDPFAALLKANQLLRPGGSLLLSVPNVGHWAVVADLLEGRFDYQPVGTLCNTHKYFFTRNSLESLLTDTGFVVQAWHDVGMPMPTTLADAIGRCDSADVKLDRQSLETLCFHVVAGKS